MYMGITGVSCGVSVPQVVRWLFICHPELPKLGAQLVISGLISVFVAMMIFLIASMDKRVPP
jgi:hypothetical protein